MTGAEMTGAEMTGADPAERMAMPSGQTAIFPLSAAQERLWIVEQIAPGTAAYHIPVVLRLRGDLNVPALREALQRVVGRHEALRTSISRIDGRPVQVVSESVAVPIEVTDGLACQAVASEVSAPFDLAAGPLIRARLFRIAAGEHLLAITIHHLVADLWSCGILLHELAACYAEVATGSPAELADLGLQYPDFCLWERDWLAGERLEALRGYWCDRMAGVAQELDLPADHLRPPVQTLRGHQVEVSLSAELSSRVRDLVRTYRVTPFAVMLAAFQILISRCTQQDDFVVSTGTATRTPETEQVVGCFINIIPLRGSIAGDQTFAELLTSVSEATLGALDHSGMPFDQLISDLRPRRDLSRNPFAQVMFILQNAPISAPALPGLAVSVEHADRGGAQCDLNIQLRDEDGHYSGFAEYAADLFEPETVRAIWARFETLLSCAVADPDRPIHDLPWLPDATIERQVRDWNLTAAPVEERCIHQLFEGRVAAAPAAPALAWPGGQMEYAELDRRAEAIAARLADLGAGPDVPVAICLERSPELVTAALAVLKAGGAYVPLDASYPAERLAFMLADARPAVLVTSSELLGRLPVDAATGEVRGGDGRISVLRLDDGASRLAEPAERAARHRVPAVPGGLAYIIYTSGSTGNPKGVAVTHSGAVNNIADLNRREGVGPGDRVLALSASGFDMSVYELLGMLCAGGTVILPEPAMARDPRHWADLIEAHQVTIWNSAPSLLEALVDAYGDRRPARPSLRAAFLGGDWIPVGLPGRARALFPQLSVHALGGATEASIHSIDFPVGEVGADWLHIPYGRPMANQQALIVDRQLRVVPPGVPGELCLAGLGLSRGYLRRPGLTAARFVPHPYAGAFAGIPPGARMYLTGDSCRYAADGTIHLIGRLDHQVKVRGFRIELGEVDTALRRHPAITAAVTVARRDDSGRGVGLVAYVVPDAAGCPDTTELRAFLKKSLPDYMLPEVFVPLDALPLSANGKVNRHALPAPEPHRPALGNEYVPPSTTLERAIADIWLSVLRIDQVGVADDFFELGGDSLGVTQVAAAMADYLRTDISLRDFFEAPTVAGQARAAQAAARSCGVDADAIASIYLQVRSLTEEEAKNLLAETEDAA